MLDVCLIVEGYPYAADGVARWVSEHLTGLSTLRFGLVHVGLGRDLPREPLFDVPDNVEQFVEVYPREPLPFRGHGLLARLRARLRRLPAVVGAEPRAELGELEAFYEKILAGDVDGLEAVLEVAGGPSDSGRADLDRLLQSPQAWQVFTDLYEEQAAEHGSPDRFDAWQGTHAPLLRLLRTPVPAAAVYHTVSSGMGGLLGALAAARTGAPLLLTEPTQLREEVEGASEAELFRDHFMRRTVYRRAAQTVCFSDAGLRMAVRAGASASRCRVIPEGIDVERLGGVRRKGRPTTEKDSVLVAWAGGPVVPAKDPKTFLRAAKVLAERLDLVEIALVGSTSEDFGYYRECLVQAQMLSLDRIVRFAGPMDLASLLTDADCLVLTSAVESEPTALVAAMAAGVPSVATDAGACRELLEGRSSEDRALGLAGVVCPIGDHEAVAEGVIRCLRDRSFRDRLVAAGEARADRYYRREELQAVYLATYERLRHRTAAGAASKAP